MLHVICTRLHPGHLSVRAGDCSRRCEEIVKKSRISSVHAITISSGMVEGVVEVRIRGSTWWSTNGCSRKVEGVMVVLTVVVVMTMVLVVTRVTMLVSVAEVRVG